MFRQPAALVAHNLGQALADIPETDKGQTIGMHNVTPFLLESVETCVLRVPYSVLRVPCNDLYIAILARFTSASVHHSAFHPISASTRAMSNAPSTWSASRS